MRNSKKTFERTIDTDVLVVGCGGAGLRVAIEASAQGVRSVIVSKGNIPRSGVTMLAGADITLDGKSLSELGFPGDPRDSKEKFFKDIVTQGFYLNNQKLVELFVGGAQARVKELIDWGMNIKWTEPRAVHTTGLDITNALYREVRRHDIQLVDEMMITDLLTKGRKVVGAVGLDIKSGEFVLFKSRAVVLATGGWHKAYELNTGTIDMSGDGQAMAFRAGAELVNMEMITFCPNIILWPPIFRGSIFLYMFHMFCGTLLNSKGEDFMARYDSKIAQIGTKTEWNKLILSIATMREVRAGRGGPHFGVYYSLKGVPWETVENSQMMTYYASNAKFQGQDFGKTIESLKKGEPIEVAPAAHYFEGGIRINEKCETTIPGLYAAGECSGGLFGANRVAAATTEILVEGAVAGKSAAEYAKGLNTAEINEHQVENFRSKVFQPLKRRKGASAIKLRKCLQKICYERIGVMRSDATLRKAISEIARMRTTGLPTVCVKTRSLQYNRELVEALELENLLQVVEISARSALARTESRGVHYRLDYPHLNNDVWLKEIVFSKVDGKPKMSMHPVTVTALTPPRGQMTFEEAILMAIEASQA